MVSPQTTPPSPNFELNPWSWATPVALRAGQYVQLYRYVSLVQAEQIRDSGALASRGIVYLSPDRYSDPDRAQRLLALPRKPEVRIGPIWLLDVFVDAMPFQVVPPQFGQPGGGWQVATTRNVPFGERYAL